MIYYATEGMIPVGPYHPDEFRAQLRIRQALGNSGQGPVYRIEARDLKEAAMKMKTKGSE